MTLVVFGSIVVLAAIVQFFTHKKWIRQFALIADSTPIPFLANRPETFWLRVSLPFLVFMGAIGVILVVIGATIL